jgi:sugar phosphate isomerase/epimerase
MLRGSTITLEDYPVEQAVDIFRRCGFTSLEMWVHHLKKCRTPDLRGQFVQYTGSTGIEMGGLNVVGEDYFQPFGTDAELEATLSGLRKDLEFARSLGARDVLIWEGRAPEGTTETHWLDRLLPKLTELLRTAIADAKTLGMRFLVEPHPFTVGMSDRFLVSLCDSLDPDHFGVTYDFCHYGVARKTDYIAAVYNLGHRIRHLHFSDSDQQSSELHFPPGAGRMDIAGILKAFREIRYDGTITLDLYGYPTPVEALERSVPRLREACDFLGIGSSQETSAAYPR